MIPLQFNCIDKEKYNIAKRAIIQILDVIISPRAVRNGCVTAISKINALRMVRNLRCSTGPKDAIPSDCTSRGSVTGGAHGALGIMKELFEIVI